ncbi:MAG: hypothetical protein KJZ73_13040 [Pseudorhodoplanes sp.]|nr:hypothetical protein [Pseudorhodoplanes sp.]
MTITATPIFAQSLAYGVANLSTANTNRDGTGTIGIVLTGGANGTMVDRIEICATGDTTAGVVRLFVTLDSGPTSRLWKEVLVGAITVSATVAAFMRRINCALPENALYLPSGYSLRASTHNAEGFNVHGWGSNL